METKKLEDVIELNVQEVSKQDLNDAVFVAGAKKKFAEQNAAIENLIDLNINKMNFNDFNNIAFVSGGEKIAEVEDSSINLTDENIDLLVNKIASAMTNVANLQYKGSTFIEPCEVEKVKNTIFQDEKISASKREELEEELTKFQNEITTNYKEAINDYNEKRVYCDTQIEMYEQAKKEIVMKRASQMLWPFDDRTRAFDSKIASLKIQSLRYSQKVKDIESMRPAATEKDLLMFQVQLKDKFSA